MTFPETDAQVLCDRTRLKQVLLNRLSNAIKYSRDQGSIIVSCTMNRLKRLYIGIRDSEAGLISEQQMKLFQAFNRPGQMAIEGSGIGLVLTKRLVELMGVAIGVESSVGTGSLFWFELNTFNKEPS